ncbi:MAG: hypothetical protein U0W40_09585 [Acidimicrobiia bacterium]
MTPVTVITEHETPIEAVVTDGRVLVDPAVLPTALGWTLKPEGLCRDEVCVPVRDRDALVVHGQVDLVAAAEALRRPVVVDTSGRQGYVAVALAAEERRRALRGLEAPDVTLPDLDGTPHPLSEWGGRKRLLQAFSSW